MKWKYEKALSDAYERGYNAGLKDNGVNAVLYEGWRDARKELPPIINEVYWIYDKEGSMGTAHYLGEGIFGGWPDVIAWMPLPSPPAFV